ncbi:MAG: S8 family serine peptidase [Chitinophagales bacterium]|nr:S8 family serine peptidase [Chitinophagales bacterium]
MRYDMLRVGVVICSLFLFHKTNAGQNPLQDSLYAYQQIGLHQLSHKPSPIVIAIVDDGYLLNHRDLDGHIYTNKLEIPGNGIDDDQNGYVDDVSGYDVSDHDGDVSIPIGREKEYYHGTMIASIVLRSAKIAFGNEHPIQIMPIKALGDKATKSYLLDGYSGIAYALQQKADIIVCAWSGGKADEKQAALFTQAAANGILILAAAGNYFSEQIDAPASITNVTAVAALDTNLHKCESSNFGKKIDFSAPGTNVYAAHPIKENAYSYFDGTSTAVALAGGLAAIVKSLFPAASPTEIVAAIKNTALPIDSVNQSYAGKLGAGLINLHAIEYLTADKNSFFNSSRPEGEIWLGQNHNNLDWTIKPYGGFKGIFIQPIIAHDKQRNLTFNVTDAAGKSSVYLAGELGLGKTFYTQQLTISYKGKPQKRPLNIKYAVEPIDSAKLYCFDLVELTQPEGEIEDGSGNENYANKCACKWQIIAPEGKRIKVEFLEFDTQPKIDFVWLFEGSVTHEDMLSAKFSGPDMPPTIISRSNQLLVWFVTDNSIIAKGWKLRYSFTDEPPGVIDSTHK